MDKFPLRFRGDIKFGSRFGSKVLLDPSHNKKLVRRVRVPIAITVIFTFSLSGAWGRVTKAYAEFRGRPEVAKSATSPNKPPIVESSHKSSRVEKHTRPPQLEISMDTATPDTSERHLEPASVAVVSTTVTENPLAVDVPPSTEIPSLPIVVANGDSLVRPRLEFDCSSSSGAPEPPTVPAPDPRKTNARQSSAAKSSPSRMPIIVGGFDSAPPLRHTP
jgi:hypothetical protein